MISQKFKTVLIDDEQDSLSLLNWNIEQECPELEVVAICQGAKRGLEAIQELQPDLVFLDIEMPEMNGFEFLQAIRARDIEGVYGDVPVIMLTACGDDLEFVALERGADMFCEKFRAESLLVKQINFLLDG